MFQTVLQIYDFPQKRIRLCCEKVLSNRLVKKISDEIWTKKDSVWDQTWFGVGSVVKLGIKNDYENWE
jgi:hypothetical protein